MIEAAMVRSGGNQRVASEILGITERMLGYRLKHYGLKF
jgi:DNA-binding protein Fis